MPIPRRRWVIDSINETECVTMVQFTGCTSVQRSANAIHSVFLFLQSGTENRLLYLCCLYEIVVTVNLNMCWDDRLSGKVKLIAAAENANEKFPLWGILVCVIYCSPHVLMPHTCLLMEETSYSFSKTSGHTALADLLFCQITCIDVQNSTFRGVKPVRMHKFSTVFSW